MQSGYMTPFKYEGYDNTDLHSLYYDIVMIRRDSVAAGQMVRAKKSFPIPQMQAGEGNGGIDTNLKENRQRFIVE